MPIFRNDVAAGVAFTGTTATDGLFDITQTGAQKIQPLLRSVKFHTEGTAVAWTLRVIDPLNSLNKTLILADTSTDLAIEGGIILPVDTDGNAWALEFASAAMVGGVGFFSVDFDFVGTQG